MLKNSTNGALASFSPSGYLGSGSRTPGLMEKIPASPMAMAYGPGYSVITMSHWCRHLIAARLLLIVPGYSMVHEFFARLWPLTTVTPSKPYPGHEGIGLRARHRNGSLQIRSLSPRASCSKAATAKIITVLNPRPVSAAADCPGDGLFIDEGKYGQYKTPSGLDRSLQHSLEGLFDLGGTDS